MSPKLAWYRCEDTIIANRVHPSSLRFLVLWTTIGIISEEYRSSEPCPNSYERECGISLKSSHRSTRISEFPIRYPDDMEVWHIPIDETHSFKWCHKRTPPSVAYRIDTLSYICNCSEITRERNLESREIITPLCVPISATIIESELSITQSVCWLVLVSKLRKNQYTKIPHPRIMSDPRINRLRGDTMKFNGAIMIMVWLLHGVLVVSSTRSCYHSRHNLGYWGDTSSSLMW
jgi:hypothetical protein